MKIRGYGRIVASEVDGPGTRSVVHLAGCGIGCPGCFNPQTHDASGPGTWSASVSDLADQILAVSDRVTISGGEPTDQIWPLYSLLRALRARGVVDVVMFTGRTRGWLVSRLTGWRMIESEGLVDILIDGPFKVGDRTDAEVALVAGSGNQIVHRITDRIAYDEMFRVADLEIQIDGDTMIVTGFPDEDLLRELA